MADAIGVISRQMDPRTLLALGMRATADGEAGMGMIARWRD